MKKFVHFGVVCSEKKEGMSLIPSLGVWALCDDNDPNHIEYLYFEPDSPMKDTLVAKTSHVAYIVDDIDNKVANIKCCWGPMDAAPGIRLAFFVDEYGTLTEYCQC